VLLGHLSSTRSHLISQVRIPSWLRLLPHRTYNLPHNGMTSHVTSMMHPGNRNCRLTTSSTAFPIPAPPVNLDKRTGRQREQPSKQLKTTTTAVANFVSQAPLFEPIVPFPWDKPTITTLLAWLPVGTPFLQMGERDGKSQYIYFQSAFPSPHNKCTTSKCKNRKESLSASTCLHIDPSTEPWKSKEEDFWKPIVNFLQNLEVAQHFRPSATFISLIFISLTPSTSWN
jgi:hypothetical protein